MRKPFYVLAAVVLLAGAVALAQYNTKVYVEQGGDRQVIASGGSLDVESGGELDIESGGSFEIAGTAVSATAAELDQYVIHCIIDDISTAQSDWVVAPHAGDISSIYSVIDGAITTGDAALTFEIGGTAVTGGGITVANSGSAAGDVDSASPSAANSLTAGQALECITDGGSTNTVKAVVSVVISR